MTLCVVMCGEEENLIIERLVGDRLDMRNFLSPAYQVNRIKSDNSPKKKKNFQKLNKGAGHGITQCC